MMDDDLLARLAVEAGFLVVDDDDTGGPAVLAVMHTAEFGAMRLSITDDLRKFAELLAEHCAALAEQTFEGSCAYDDDGNGGDGYMGDNSAAEIREAFGLTKPEPFVYVPQPSPADEAYRRIVARLGEAEAIKAVRAFQDRRGWDHGAPIGDHAAYIAALDAYPNPEPGTVPTEEGKKRYPPDGLYEGDPCTCLPTCETMCEGYRSACDCLACKSAYSDAMDYADYE